MFNFSIRQLINFENKVKLVQFHVKICMLIYLDPSRSLYYDNVAILRRSYRRVKRTSFPRFIEESEADIHKDSLPYFVERLPTRYLHVLPL